MYELLVVSPQPKTSVINKEIVGVDYGCHYCSKSRIWKVFLYFVFQGEKNYYRMEQYKGKLIWLDNLMMINPLK